MKTLLITGAAGGVGRFMRRELAGRYALRLSDRAPLGDLLPGESFEQADVARLDHMLRVTAGVDAILHLGAWSVEGVYDYQWRADSYKAHQAMIKFVVHM